MEKVYFSIPYTSPASVANIRDLMASKASIGDLAYTKACVDWFESKYKGYNAFLTTTGTHAIELAARAMNFKEGDEVILPSYNYVGVANAFLNAGAKLVFIDIIPGTMNVDPECIRKAISPKTKVVSIMHYGGVACQLDEIRKICDEHDLLLFEDNAHGIGASASAGPLGGFGDMSIISFDRLKNISVHQGGVLLCKEKFTNDVDVAFDNGTNRQAFFKGKISSYSWVDRGSNYALSEFLAAALYPLLEDCEKINGARRRNWDKYHSLLSAIPAMEPYLPKGLETYGHNGHIFYMKAKDKEQRDHILRSLRQQGVEASFHYIPLHSAVAGRKFSRFNGDDVHTTRESEKLFRLPVHNNLKEGQIEMVVAALSGIVATSAAV